MRRQKINTSTTKNLGEISNYEEEKNVPSLRSKNFKKIKYLL